MTSRTPSRRGQIDAVGNGAHTSSTGETQLVPDLALLSAGNVLPRMGMELRSFYGNVMFSTGPNNELGGPNDTASHLDIPMRNCSLFLDGDIAVKEMQHNFK